MADYAKKKNDELAALCKERGLAHTGKKADLVKRLEDHDAQGATGTVPATTSKPEDDIDWDDPPTEPAGAAAMAAGGVGEVANPVAVPNQVQVEDPTQANGLTINPPAEEEKPVAKDYSAGISDATLDAEIEKRKKRAERFGLPVDSEEIKMLERAKRFGTADLPGLLNKALPTAADRKRGGGDHDGGIRKQSRGRHGGRNRGRGGGGGGDNPRSAQAQGGSGSWMSAEDRQKAEARKARFNPAPAA